MKKEMNSYYLKWVTEMNEQMDGWMDRMDGYLKLHINHTTECLGKGSSLFRTSY